jgi:hypothetical protein
MFKADDWSAFLEKLKSADEKFTSFTKSIDSERVRLGLCRSCIEEHLVELD